MKGYPKNFNPKKPRGILHGSGGSLDQLKDMIEKKFYYGGATVAFEPFDKNTWVIIVNGKLSRDLILKKLAGRYRFEMLEHPHELKLEPIKGNPMRNNKHIRRNPKLPARLKKAKESLHEILRKEYYKDFKDDENIQDSIKELESSDNVMFIEGGDLVRYTYINFDKHDWEDADEAMEFLEEYLSDDGYYIEWYHKIIFIHEGDYIATYNDDENVYSEGSKIIDKKLFKDEDGDIDYELKYKLIEDHMEKTGFYPGVYIISERGDVYSDKDYYTWLKKKNAKIKKNPKKRKAEGKHSKIRIIKTMNLLEKEKVDPEYASPNYVAEFAYERGIALSSDEVVYISDNYGVD